MMNVLMRAPGRSMEGKDQQPEHVKDGEPGSQHANKPKHLAVAGEIPRAPQNGILTENAWQRRNPGDCYGSGQKRCVGPGHQFPESAHLLNILDSSHTVDDASGTEKQQGLKESVRHQVKNSR